MHHILFSNSKTLLNMGSKKNVSAHVSRGKFKKKESLQESNGSVKVTG